MKKCFVIQPFDDGKFDKRYRDVYAPAIKAAGLEPYRVDKDPTTTVPIDAIEKGIRTSVICLAEITTDNPNVWYELGYAFALKRPIVMVCSEERVKYPFDVQHRTITRYKTESSCDFSALKHKVETRLRAQLDQNNAPENIQNSEQTALLVGLSQLEVAILSEIASRLVTTEEKISASLIKGSVENAGFPPAGFIVGFKKLIEKNMVAVTEETEYDGHFEEVYKAVSITGNGWQWIEANEDKFLLKQIQREPKSLPDVDEGDVPF
jgi:nucleoside 2-deoxyribosyltransferase